MPRARGPHRDKAYELWKKSGGSRSLKSIADELGVGASRVRKWKSEDKWEQKKALPNKGAAKRNAPPKRGAPYGNQNAKGHGGPPGNTYALKHGAYANVLASMLDPDEASVLLDETTAQDVEHDLVQTIGELNVKEIRLTRFITKLREEIGDASLMKSKTATHEERNGSETKQNARIVTKLKVTPVEAIAKLECELDRAQGRKIRALESLEKLRADRRKAEMEARDIEMDVAAAWVEGALATEKERGGDDGADIDSTCD